MGCFNQLNKLDEKNIVLISRSWVLQNLMDEGCQDMSPLDADVNKRRLSPAGRLRLEDSQTVLIRV